MKCCQYVFFRMAFENVQFTALSLVGNPSSFQVSGERVYDKITAALRRRRDAQA